jgi:hypothetical protein
MPNYDYMAERKSQDASKELEISDIMAAGKVSRKQAEEIVAKQKSKRTRSMGEDLQKAQQKEEAEKVSSEEKRQKASLSKIDPELKEEYGTSEAAPSENAPGTAEAAPEEGVPGKIKDPKEAIPEINKPVNAEVTNLKKQLSVSNKKIKELEAGSKSWDKSSYEVPKKDKNDFKTELRLIQAQLKDGKKYLRQRELWEKLAHAFGKIGAGHYGLKHGVDMSGIKFDKTDWQKEMAGLRSEIELKLSDLKARRVEAISEAQMKGKARDRALTRDQQRLDRQDTKEFREATLGQKQQAAATKLATIQRKWSREDRKDLDDAYNLATKEGDENYWLQLKSKLEARGIPSNHTEAAMDDPWLFGESRASKFSKLINIAGARPAAPSGAPAAQQPPGSAVADSTPKEVQLYWQGKPSLKVIKDSAAYNDAKAKGYTDAPGR